MKLKRLIVQGFKSFKDRTVIHFDDGITGIVGPNGCGKSNIVDALFWVMGEQSAKHLRGNSMKDVIFAGSSQYSPAAWAEATLVLGNDSLKHVHIGNKVCTPSEIQLTRKLYRNGETEYRINDTPCRLRDIQEVFMDTGAGAKSYSIIAQGEINRLVQAKPEERRVMIEEVAGITKFKLRKKESAKKIEQATSNLGRLQDLQTEVEKNLKSLEAQSQKALKARKLKEEMQRNELIVASHKEYDILSSTTELRSQLVQNRVALETMQIQRDNLEIGLEDERLQKQELSENIEELQERYNELSRVLAGSEERVKSLAKSQEEKDKQILTREKEIEQIQIDLEDREKKRDDLASQYDHLMGLGQEELDFSELEEQVAYLKEQLEDKDQELKEIQKTHREFQDQLRDCEQQLYLNGSRLQEYAGQLEDIAEEVETLENQYSDAHHELSAEREQVERLAIELSSQEEKEKNLKSEVENFKQLHTQSEKDEQIHRRALMQAESKLASLQEIQTSFEDFEGKDASVAEFLSDPAHAENFALLGHHIECEPEYTAAVQQVLKPYLKAVIALNDDAVLTSLPSVSGLHFWQPGDKFDSKNETNWISLGSVIKSEKIAPYLQGLYIDSDLNSENVWELVDSLQQNSKQNSEMTLAAPVKAIVNLEGTIVIRILDLQRGEVLVHFAGPQNAQEAQAGMIARNNRITVLQQEKEELTFLCQQAEVIKDQTKLQWLSAQESYEHTRHQLFECKSSHGAKAAALESRKSSYDTGNKRLEILHKRKSELSKLRLDLLVEEEKLTAQKEIFESQLESLTEEKEQLTEQIEMQRDTYQAQRDDLIYKQVEAKSIDERIRSVKSQIDDVKVQTKKYEERLKSNTELIEELRVKIENEREEYEAMKERNEDFVEDLQSQQDVLSHHKDRLVQLLLGMQEREKEAKRLSAEMNKVDKTLTEIEVKVQRQLADEEFIVRDTIEKYRINLRQTIGHYLGLQESEYEGLMNIDSVLFQETEFGPEPLAMQSYEFHRRYGQDLKACENRLRNARSEFNALGEINWQAVEEYDRQKLRFDFLKEQSEELKKSIEDLQQAIAHIDEKSKLRFKESFDDVNMRFEKVFPIIFGGGMARLEMTGTVDDPDAGVDIVAQPPGKKMQNINLMSGGEKALTAVSLIFSIFLVKPSPFCLLDEVDAPLDDANVGRFNELLREMSEQSQFILITHNKKTMELNDTLYGVTMQEPGVSKAVSVQLQ